MPEETAYEQLKSKVKIRLARLLQDHEFNGQEVSSASRERVAGQIQQVLGQVLEMLPAELRQHAAAAEQRQRLIRELTEEIVGIGPLESLLMDPEVTEIMVNGAQQVYAERQGSLQLTGVTFHDTAHLMAMIERLLDQAGVAVTESEPCVDASLSDGSRINVVLPPVSVSGPTVTIRKRLRQISAEELVSLGSISPQAATFLEVCVKSRVNMIVAGGTSTGKTTLVGILSAFIPPEERIITIENVAELELPHRPHWVRLVARLPNLEGRGEVSLRTLVKNALRMRPDRIILGEARGGEALDIVQAMQTGHEGVITVLHANSPEGALERLETLMLMSGLDMPLSACRHQVAQAVELIIQLSRFPDGSRRIERIVQVTGTKSAGFLTEDLFAVQVQAAGEGASAIGPLAPTGVLPRFTKKFIRHHQEVPAGLFQPSS